MAANPDRTTSTASARVSGPLLVSSVALGIAAVILISGALSIFSAALAGGTGEVKASEELARLIANHEKKLDLYQDRFNGRSVFFDPPPKPKPYQPPAKVIETPREEPKPIVDPPPATYTGPSVIYAIGDSITFQPMSASDNKQFSLRVGQSKGDLTVVEVNLPWSVKLTWKGAGPFDVPIFNRGPDSFFMQAPAPTVFVPGFISVPPEKVQTEVPKASGNGEGFVGKSDLEGDDPNNADDEDVKEDDEAGRAAKESGEEDEEQVVEEEDEDEGEDQPGTPPSGQGDDADEDEEEEPEAEDEGEETGDRPVTPTPPNPDSPQPQPQPSSGPQPSVAPAAPVNPKG